MTEIPTPPNHPASASAKRVKCGACGKTVAVRKDGTLWHHRSLQLEYPGSIWRKVCNRSGWDAERASKPAEVSR